MCAVWQEPKTWSFSLLTQQRSACGGRSTSRSRRSTSICSSELLNTSVRHDSTSSSEVSALNLCRLSPQIRRRFAVLVACWCGFLFINHNRTDFLQNLQLQQINCVAVRDFFEDHEQQDHHRLSRLFSRDSPLPRLQGARAAAAAPPSHTAAEDNEAARAKTAENEFLPSSAVAVTGRGLAATARPTRHGVARRRAALQDVGDVKSKQQRLAQVSYAQVLQQHHIQGSRKKEEEERGEEQEEREERGRQQYYAETGSTAQQAREEDSHTKKQPSTQLLQSPTANSLLERLKFWKKASTHDDETKEQQQPPAGEESVEEQESDAAPYSSIKSSTSAAAPAAPTPAAGPGGEHSYLEQVVAYPLYTGAAARRWEMRARAEDVITGLETGGRKTNRRRYRSFSTLEDAGTGVRALQRTTGAGGAHDVVGISVVSAAFPSGLLPAGTYAVRRRLAAVPGVQANTGARDRGNTYSSGNGSGGRMQSDLSTFMRQQAQAQEATVIADTGDQDAELGDSLEEPTLADVSRTRGIKRRRRGREQSRGPVLDSMWGDTGKRYVAGVTPAIEKAEGPQKFTYVKEEKEHAKQQLPNRSAWLPQPSPEVGTDESNREGRGGIGSSTGEGFSSGGPGFLRGSVTSSVGGGTAGTAGRGANSNLGGPVWGYHSDGIVLPLKEKNASQGGPNTSSLTSSMAWAGDAPRGGGRVSLVSSRQRAPWSASSGVYSGRQAGLPAPWTPTGDAYISSFAGGDISSGTGTTRHRQHFQQPSVLNDVLGTGTGVGNDAVSSRRRGGILVSPMPDASIQSVIDLGLTPDEAAEADGGNQGMHSLVHPLMRQKHGQQQLLQYGVATESEALRRVGDVGRNGKNGALWSAGEQQEIEEETAEMKQLLEQQYIVKPLRKRQRITLMLSVVLNIVSAVLLGSLAARFMDAYDLSMPLQYLVLGGMGVMVLGQNIVKGLKLAAVALQLLVQDLFLRRKRQQLVTVAEALQTIREQDERAQLREEESEDERAAADALRHETGHPTLHGEAEIPNVTFDTGSSDINSPWL